MQRSQLVLSTLFFVACGGGATIVDPPPPPSSDFVLTFRPDAEDQASAQTLGWGSAVPDADVTLTPKDPLLGGPRTYRTTAAGMVTISALTAGDYVVEVKRWLDDSERGKLPAGDDAIGYVAKAYVRVTTGSGQSSIAVPASRRRSLVISEFFNNYINIIPDGYYDNSFVELHNNADTAIYVDGMLLAAARNPSNDYPNFPCSLYDPERLDPGGAWVRWVEKFPGTGRDYPVAPGGTIVIATDAIDHSAIVAGGFDLRSAHFEMIGSADVDNPTVPNMIDLTEGGAGSISGHGMFWPHNSPVTVLALPVDLSALPREAIPAQGGVPFLRLPRERILDALSFHTTSVSAYPDCTFMIHTNLDRAMAYLFRWTDFALSGQRKTVLILPSGRKIVQHTRSSDADFKAAPRSPGTLP